MKRLKLILLSLLLSGACFAKQAIDIDEIIAKANSSEAESQLALATFYATGQNLEQDNAKALYWLNLAVKQNYVPAIFYMGYVYAEGKLVKKDMDKAVYFRELAAKLGSDRDKFTLGTAYLFGFYVPKDIQRGLYWLRLAGENGDVEAITKLIDLYKNAKEKDNLAYWTSKYANLEIEAAKKGNVEAMYSISNKYMKGKDGLPKDMLEALTWLQIAANAGHKEAMEDLAKQYKSGKYLKPNPQKALELYIKLGASDSRFYQDVANIYLRDLPNEELAELYLKKAVAQQDSFSKLSLVWRYWAGVGIKQDLTKAKQGCVEVLKNSKVDMNGEVDPIAELAKTMLRDIASDKIAPSNFSDYYKQVYEKNKTKALK